MAKISAGLLMFRIVNDQPQVLLAHPGGPFWRNKDLGAWTIPKGEVAEGEEPLAAAQREFNEETGLESTGPFFALGSIKQKSGKTVHAWAFEGDCDPACIRSNTFELEWPPRSGKKVAAPEVDRAEFFSIDEARRRINPAQVALLEKLLQLVSWPDSHTAAPDQPAR